MTLGVPVFILPHSLTVAAFCKNSAWPPSVSPGETVGVAVGDMFWPFAPEGQHGAAQSLAPHRLPFVCAARWGFIATAHCPSSKLRGCYQAVAGSFSSALAQCFIMSHPCYPPAGPEYCSLSHYPMSGIASDEAIFTVRTRRKANVFASGQFLCAMCGFLRVGDGGFTEFHSCF